ncbi:MAG: WecB/TagA/CpsF family glycosyltransferase [Candidatus Didemnitutus sp.]|nr:WecB/TagA/CpsF family glycosyltransferase [Candidatus Didemnitutus sp.]
MTPPARFNVLGTGVHALSLDDACARVLACRTQPPQGYVGCATAYNLNAARSDPALRAAYNRALLTTPDGMPLVWLGRWHGHRHITRVYGPDLLLAVCDAGRAVGLKHFFYGGKPGVAEQLRTQLTARFPGLSGVGTFTPPFRPLNATEFAELQTEIARARPDVIWVGLSTPKQEQFMAEAWSKLDASVLIGVGAAFDFHSGNLPQAPRWLQRGGLEWLFRFAHEPRRLWRRYLVHNPLFVLRSLAQLCGLCRYPLN